MLCAGQHSILSISHELLSLIPWQVKSLSRTLPGRPNCRTDLPNLHLYFGQLFYNLTLNSRDVPKPELCTFHDILSVKFVNLSLLSNKPDVLFGEVK